MLIYFYSVFTLLFEGYFADVLTTFAYTVAEGGTGATESTEGYSKTHLFIFFCLFMGK